MTSDSYTAFAGPRRLASGELTLVALAAYQVERAADSSILVFNDATGRVVDLDLRGTAEEVVARLAPAGEAKSPRGPGRPKLGVVAREVTLLPRHWEWLSAQPGGASVALRKLVEDARRTHAGRDRVRLAQDAAYRFMLTMAGNEPGYEEALRALYGGQRQQFEERIANWPADIREHAMRLAAAAFEP